MVKYKAESNKPTVKHQKINFAWPVFTASWDFSRFTRIFSEFLGSGTRAAAFKTTPTFNSQTLSFWITYTVVKYKAENNKITVKHQKIHFTCAVFTAGWDFSRFTRNFSGIFRGSRKCVRASRAQFQTALYWHISPFTPCWSTTLHKHKLTHSTPKTHPNKTQPITPLPPWWSIPPTRGKDLRVLFFSFPKKVEKNDGQILGAKA